jgi:hypothetical protein
MPVNMVANVLGKSWLIKKAWTNDDGSVNIEGWVSTNDRDIEKDILEPEAFAGSLEGYFARGAPISSEHNTDDLPVGYMIKAALVRDGHIFQEASNSRYTPTDFKYFDGTGTGWYGLGVIDEERSSVAVQKGKLSSFSWIGMPKAWEPLPGGGRHFNQQGAIDPLLEATVTAYPINPTAVMRIAKAHGYPVAAPRPRLVLTREGVERLLRNEPHGNN